MVNPRYGLDSCEWIHFAFTVAAGPFGGNAQDFGLSGSTSQALPLVHSCSVPQWVQNTRPGTDGRRAKDTSSISMPVSSGCPLTGQLVKIFGMPSHLSVVGGH
jgi:hypothetical protein